VGELHPENLIPAKKGEIRNPKGRPKGSYSLTAILRKALQREIDFKDPITQEKVKKTLGDVVMMQLISAAVKGDISAIREIADRIEGKTAQTKINVVQGDQVINNMNISKEQGEELDAFILERIGRAQPAEFSDMEPGLPED